jgi:hypothetical protein
MKLIDLIKTMELLHIITFYEPFSENLLSFTIKIIDNKNCAL